MKRRITAIIMSLVLVTALTTYFAPMTTAQAEESLITEEGLLAKPTTEEDLSDYDTGDDLEAQEDEDYLAEETYAP